MVLRSEHGEAEGIRERTVERAAMCFANTGAASQRGLSVQNGAGLARLLEWDCAAKALHEAWKKTTPDALIASDGKTRDWEALHKADRSVAKRAAEGGLGGDAGRCFVLSRAIAVASRSVRAWPDEQEALLSELLAMGEVAFEAERGQRMVHLAVDFCKFVKDNPSEAYEADELRRGVAGHCEKLAGAITAHLRSCSTLLGGLDRRGKQHEILFVAVVESWEKEVQGRKVATCSVFDCSDEILCDRVGV